MHLFVAWIHCTQSVASVHRPWRLWTCQQHVALNATLPEECSLLGLLATFCMPAQQACETKLLTRGGFFRLANKPSRCYGSNQWVDFVVSLENKATG